MLGLCSAFAASACYGTASVLQALGTRRAAPATSPGVVGGLASIGREPVYVAGLAVDGVGFVVSLVALHTLPLFVTEAVLAASVGFTAAGAALWLHARPSRSEIAALAALLAGLTLLAVSAGAAPSVDLRRPAEVVLLAAAVAVSAVFAALARRLGGRPRLVPDRSPHAALLLAVTAGLGFAGLGVTVRVMGIPHQWWQLAAHPSLYALILFGVTGIAGFALAVQRGSVTAVAAVVFSVETLVPALTGVAVLGDRPRAGFAPLAVLGFAVTVIATVLLSRYADPAPERLADEQTPSGSAAAI